MPSELKNEPWLNPFLRDVRGTVFFDVGANCGEFTEWASTRFTCVWAFEPDPRAFSKLLARSKCNVVPFKKAVAANSYRGRLGVSTQSLQSMLMEDNRTCHPFGHGSFEHEIGVDVVALRDVDMVADWIKIDVEGGEPDVIRGMTDNTPNLIVECHGNLAEVLAELRLKGYLGDRRGVVIDHPLGCEGHKWVLAEGQFGFPENLKGVTNVAD